MMMRRLMILMVAVIGMFGSNAFATYDVGLGRWLQKDPAGHVDGMNSYQYVRSSPGVHNDPNGLKSRKIIAVFRGQDFFGLEGWFGGDANAVMAPLIANLKRIPDTLVGGPFSEDSDNSNQIIRWFENAIQDQEDGGKYCDKPKLFLMGHSNGGDAARKIAKRKFPRMNWDVELLVTLDPVGKPYHNYASVHGVGTRTRDWINYYQREASFRAFGFRFQGYRLAGGDSFNEIEENFTPGSVGPHVDIAYRRGVLDDISERVRRK